MYYAAGGSIVPTPRGMKINDSPAVSFILVFIDNA
jgi:hypothetical protein